MVGMNPLEFLEEVQREYMINTFGEILNYDKMYSDASFFDFLQKEYNFKDCDRDKMMRSLHEMRSRHMISQYENPYYYKYLVIVKKCVVNGKLN